MAAPKKHKTYPGQRFGMLVIVQRTSDDKKTRSPNLKKRVVVDCDCGRRETIPVYYLTRGHTPKRSCGCANKGLPTLHKLEYASWYMMNVRCSVPTHIAYKHYGGRGISVCNRWNYKNPGAFANFLGDVPPRPSRDYSLDRKNPNKDYEPGNVRWATSEEQNNNKRIHHLPPSPPEIDQDPEVLPETALIVEDTSDSNETG